MELSITERRKQLLDSTVVSLSNLKIREDILRGYIYDESRGTTISKCNTVVYYLDGEYSAGVNKENKLMLNPQDVATLFAAEDVAKIYKAVVRNGLNELLHPTAATPLYWYKLRLAKNLKQQVETEELILMLTKAIQLK